jgi:hypothetical protein
MNFLIFFLKLIHKFEAIVVGKDIFCDLDLLKFVGSSHDQSTSVTVQLQWGL